MRAPELRINQERRFETGCIATLTRRGETTALHFTGNGLEATRAVADYCDAHGWRILALSTPATIFRDLQGSREMTKRAPGSGTSWFYADPPANELALPEETMLSRIGRLDLLVVRKVTL